MPPIPPPGIPPSVQLSPQLAPSGKYPANVQAKELDNPPLTRSIVPGAVQPSYVVSDPFNGLGVLEILNIRAALNARLQFLDDPSNREANPDNVAAVKNVLQIINAKLDPKPRNQGLVALPIPPPPPALLGTVPMPQPISLEAKIVSGDLGPGS